MDVDGRYLAAGHDAVLSCDPDGVHAEYAVEFDNGRFEVTTVFIGGIDNACIPGWESLKVALSGPNGLLAVRPLTYQNIGNNSVAVDFTPDNIAVEDVTGIDVVIAS
jgi:hypothetical protein